MSKPALLDLVSGQQGWDARVNDNNAKLRDKPMPVKEYASLAALIADADPTTHDRCVAALTDGTLWISNGTSWVPVEGGSTNGAYSSRKTNEAASGALSGASYTFTDLFPANVIRIGVSLRVITAITGATTFDAGDGTDVDRYGAALAIALDTVADFSDATADPSSGGWNGSTGDVVLTANGSNFTGGEVRAVAHYFEVAAPQS